MGEDSLILNGCQVYAGREVESDSLSVEGRKIEMLHTRGRSTVLRRKKVDAEGVFQDNDPMMSSIWRLFCF